MKISKYKIIEESILRDIKEKKYKLGDQIPTEAELGRDFNASRMTVNKAILSLVSKGYIERIAGKGSFVSGQFIEKPLIKKPRSFTEDMKSIGRTAGAVLLEYKILRGYELPEKILKNLQAEPNDFIHYFSRLRTGDNIIFAVSYDYVPCKTLPVIEASKLEGSFFKYFEESGLKIGSTELTITATLPTEEQKKLLKISNEALLKVSHITELNDGKILEYIDTYYIGSMYSYKSYIAK